MKRFILTIAAIATIGMACAQSPGLLVGVLTEKIIIGTNNYNKNLLQAQTQALNVVSPHFYPPPMNIVDLPKRVTPVTPIKKDIGRFIYSSGEIECLQKKAFDEQYRLIFPMNTTLSWPKNDIHLVRMKKKFY